MKETIVNVFWKKSDVRQLFERSEVSLELVNAQDWNQYKYLIVSPILDVLNTISEGLGPLRRILQETLGYTDGDHLLWLSDGKKRKREAERCLEHLRLLVKEHIQIMQTKEEESQARQKRAEERQKAATFQAKLLDIKNRFSAFVFSSSPQRRGYALEEILYDLFLLFELSPRGPFRRTGEQIDGAFIHDNDDYLLEAKWQTAAVNLADLRDLDGAVSSSLDNTLGLFISVNQFSDEAVKAYTQGSRPKIIYMEGSDLVMVLEGQIDLSDLLHRKREIAVQKRIILAHASDIIQGRI
jgi:hypothetical protein